MELAFFGATGETTGSCHMVRLGRSTVLLDCGLFQGRREESYRKNARCAFDPRKVTAVVQSHAHVDHSGKLPMLVRHGFAGTIHATPATRDLCEILLFDCAHIMMKDAEFMNRQRIRKKLADSRKSPKARRSRAHAVDRIDPRLPAPARGNEAASTPIVLPDKEVLPLYLADDVVDTLRLFRDHPYGEWFEAAPGMRFRFHEAGHILGSTWIEGDIGGERLVFTGDYGRYHQPILRDPEPLVPADVYITESTYGNRVHPPLEVLEEELAAIVRRLAARGRGRVLIPAFAVGRTQHILYALSRIFHTQRAPPVRVVVDSPLAHAATQIVVRHRECLDADALAEYERYQSDPSFRAYLAFTESVDESKALNTDPRPTIIVSASGMMETGRILHHLARNVGSPETEILIVGFQAAHTLGRRLLDGAPTIRIHGVEHRVGARVTALLGFSAHADRNDLLAALAPHADRARGVFLVHGEDSERAPLARELAARGFPRVEQPSDSRSFRI